MQTVLLGDLAYLYTVRFDQFTKYLWAHHKLNSPHQPNRIYRSWDRKLSVYFNEIIKLDILFWVAHFPDGLVKTPPFIDDTPEVMPSTQTTCHDNPIAPMSRGLIQIVTESSE